MSRATRAPRRQGFLTTASAKSLVRVSSWRLAFLLLLYLSHLSFGGFSEKLMIIAMSIAFAAQVVGFGHLPRRVVLISFGRVLRLSG